MVWLLDFLDLKYCTMHGGPPDRRGPSTLRSQGTFEGEIRIVLLVEGLRCCLTEILGFVVFKSNFGLTLRSMHAHEWLIGCKH